MQRKVLAALLVASFLSLAGCLKDTDDGPDDADPTTGLLVADSEAFFDGALYDPAVLDLDVLSKVRFDILPVEETWVTMSDGVRINTGVYRPDTADPSPVFINFSPYHGDKATDRGDGFSQYMIDHFVPRGYTVVLAGIRGTGHSEGCFEVASDREAMDLKEVVDFFATQSWSNGNVGAGGKSYDSTTQNGMIAKFPTSNLKTVLHVSGITDMYSYTFQNGVPARIDAPAFTPQYSVGQGTHEYGNFIGAGAGDASSDDENLDSIARLPGDIACTENPETIAFPVATEAAGAKTPYWVERDWTRTIGQSSWEGSIFFYHGLQDWNVQPSHILPWLANLPDAIQAKVWLHQNTFNGGHVYPMRTDWNLTMLQYLDSELKGIDTGFWAGPRDEVKGSDGLWRGSDDWPNEGEVLDLPMGSGGVVLKADDHALRMPGAPTITATATPLSPDAVFTAILYDVDGNGTMTWHDEAVLRLLYRDGMDVPSPVVVGQPVTFTVAFYAQDNVLAPGHSWVLSLQEATRHSIVLDQELAGLTVSSATLHAVVVDAAEGVLEAQPVPTQCFAC